MKNSTKLKKFPTLQTFHEQPNYDLKIKRPSLNTQTNQQKYIADIYYLPYSKIKLTNQSQQRSDAVYFLTQCVKQKDFQLPKDFKQEEEQQKQKIHPQTQPKKLETKNFTNMKKLSPIQKAKDEYFEFDIAFASQNKPNHRIIQKRPLQEVFEEEYEIKSPTLSEKQQLKQHLNLPISNKFKKYGSQHKYFNSQIIHRNTLRKGQVFKKIKSSGSIQIKYDNNINSIQHEIKSPRNQPLIKKDSQNLEYQPLTRSKNRLISSESIDQTQYLTMTQDEVQDYYMQMKNKIFQKNFNFKLNPLRTTQNFKLNKYPQDFIIEEQENQDSLSYLN